MEPRLTREGRIEIRPARPEDAPAINDIYNHSVRNSTATFDIEEKSEEERLLWLAEHGDKYPIIVAVADSRVVGWGSLSRYGERPGWKFTVENAVYVHPDFCGQGIGKSILESLVDLGKSFGFGAIVAQIVGGNEASIRLHEKCGFKTVGVLMDVGFKFDKWLDVVIMERILR